MSVLILILRGYFSILFLSSFLGKIVSPDSLKSSIKKYQIVPLITAGFLTWFIIIEEIVLSILLLLGWYLELVGYNVAILMGVFALAGFIVMIRKQNIECGCFGILRKEKVSKQTIARDLVLLLLALMIALYGQISPNITTLLSASILSRILLSLFILLYSYMIFKVVWAKMLDKKRKHIITRSQIQLESWVKQKTGNIT
jgi:uncharacterized membrane protein YphA (DoxX/SURF4 family)